MQQCAVAKVVLPWPVECKSWSPWALRIKNPSESKKTAPVPTEHLTTSDCMMEGYREAKSKVTTGSS